MFDVIRTHPSAQGHGSERGLEAVHVKQKRAIVTLDEGGHSTTPAEERDVMGDFWGKVEKFKTTLLQKGPFLHSLHSSVLVTLPSF